MPNSPTAAQVHRALLYAARRKPMILSELIMAHAGQTVRRHPMHVKLCDVLEACARVSRNATIHFPPEHGKSTLILPYLISLLAGVPTRKIGIVSSDKDLAEEHLMRIRKAIVGSVVQTVFPHLRPDLKMSSASHGEWSKTKLYLAGQDQPAFEVIPLYAASEGHRLDVIYLDDVCNRQGMTSEAERLRANAAVFGTFLNRLTPGGFVIWSNNCWHREDAFHKARESEGFATLWVSYRGTEALTWQVRDLPDWTGKTSGEWPLWEQWPVERLREKRQESGPFYTRLYEGRAVQTEDCRFPGRDTWARYTPEELEAAVKGGGQFYGFLDPSGGKRADKGDWAALTGLLATRDRIAYVVDAWVNRVAPSAQVRACFDAEGVLRRKWGRGFLRFEVEMLPNTEGFVRQPFDHDRVERQKARDDGWQLPWRIRNPKEPKESRIERLGPPLENGWLKWPAGLEALIDAPTPAGRSWRRLVEGIEEWPMADHDDAPDSLAGAVAMALGPSPVGTLDRGKLGI